MMNRDDLFGGKSIPDLGGMGRVPVRRAPTKQEQASFICPSGCKPPLIMNAIPNPGAVARSFNRCLRCLTYWEVSPSGEVINIRTIKDTFTDVWADVDPLHPMLATMRNILLNKLNKDKKEEGKKEE